MSRMESQNPSDPEARKKITPAARMRQARWLIATITGMLLIPLLWTVLNRFVPDADFLKRTFLLPADLFRPEPAERLTFLLALIPCVLFFALSLSEKAVRGASHREIRIARQSAFAGVAGGGRATVQRNSGHLARMVT